MKNSRILIQSPQKLKRPAIRKSQAVEEFPIRLFLFAADFFDKPATAAVVPATGAPPATPCRVAALEAHHLDTISASPARAQVTDVRHMSHSSAFPL
jgi:hypothetical protein